jgi:adenine-specific DNA-methyltransferase
MNIMQEEVSTVRGVDAVFEPITAVLGEARVSLPGVRIYHGDCLEHMAKMPQEILALTVTSPPYNIGKEYEVRRPVAQYVSWCESWMQEVHRLTCPTGAFWLNLGYVEYPGRAKALPLPYLLWDRIPFFVVQEIVWNYGAGVAARKSFSPRNEKFLWCVKNPGQYTFSLDDVREKSVKYPNQKKNGRLKCNPNGKNPTDVWQLPKVTSGANRASAERTEHPAQFPIALVDRIVRACSRPGELVMDPFMGSGSTAEACLRLGRPVLGFEIRSDYLAIASARVRYYLKRQATADAQRRLFPGV